MTAESEVNASKELKTRNTGPKNWSRVIVTVMVDSDVITQQQTSFTDLISGQLARAGCWSIHSIAEFDFDYSLWAPSALVWSSQFLTCNLRTRRRHVLLSLK